MYNKSIFLLFSLVINSISNLSKTYCNQNHKSNEIITDSINKENYNKENIDKNLDKIIANNDKDIFLDLYDKNVISELMMYNINKFYVQISEFEPSELESGFINHSAIILKLEKEKLVNNDNTHNFDIKYVLLELNAHNDGLLILTNTTNTKERLLKRRKLGINISKEEMNEFGNNFYNIYEWLLKNYIKNLNGSKKRFNLFTNNCNQFTNEFNSKFIKKFIELEIKYKVTI